MNIVLLLGINSLFLFIMYQYFRRRIEKRLSSEDLLDEMRKEVGGIILELNKTTERNIGLIEERLSVLKEVLETADKRIILIKREAEKHEVSTQVYNKILQKNRPQPEEGENSGESGRKALSYEEVMNLYRKGISAGIIAGKLGTTVGEVELIISLQDRKGRG